MAELGIMIEGQEGLNWERWRRLCHDVDELGFDSIWRSDHLRSVFGVEGRDCIETWTSLSLTAEWTTRLEFGPLVSPMTFRPPGLLGRMAASVDNLSGGRLVLGVGAGWYQEEHERFGIAFPDLDQRFANLEAGINTIKEVAASSRPAPARTPIPILIGGSGRRVLNLVARQADEWNAPGMSMPVERYGKQAAQLDALCADIGRDPATVRRSLMKTVLIGRDRAELLERAEAIRHVAGDVADMSPEQILHFDKWVVGTPDEVTAQLGAFADLGVTRFMLQHFLMDDRGVLELLASEVLPRLRGWPSSPSAV
jgi:alkanesulfonate monooxygenase SsuD/methylene tetrahydromethanopterin reductase-like flavin-dependent oxidoreductase (luciferase family)